MPCVVPVKFKAKLYRLLTLGDTQGSVELLFLLGLTFVISLTCLLGSWNLWCEELTIGFSALALTLT